MKPSHFAALAYLIASTGAAAAAEPSPPVPPKPPGPVQPEKPKPDAPAAGPVAEKKVNSPPAGDKSASDGSKAGDKKSIADHTKDHKRLDGLFTLYFDEKKGQLLLQLRKDQLEKEYIYFTQAVDGVVQAGYNRGQFGEELVLKFQRVFDRVQVARQPTAFYFDAASPLARAADANLSEAVLAAEGIMAEDDSHVLINAGSLFLKESLLMVKPVVKDASKSVLGRLSESKTHFRKVHNFPENSLIRVAYVFENPTPSWVEGDAEADEIADPRYVTIEIQHALIQMPENSFRPRFDDPRVGYFATQVTDMTSADITPYRDVIHRWHLQKQKPGTALSEPVEPIVFWIENTTPLELRDTIRAAALKWNGAFESAGYKDALVVKQQPDNAKWVAEDLRYNVLRWTSSPNPPFGGYGPSFVNPRTGQILGADIMLEFSYLTNRLRASRLFSEVGLAGLPAMGTPEWEGVGQGRGECLAGNCAHQGLLFGRAAVRMVPDNRLELEKLTKDALHYLVLHEVGHTLGLNHNFKSSGLHTPEQLQEAERTAKIGLMGSVMDYPSANIAPLGGKQGEYYSTCPGPYDHWAIEFGYSEALEDPVMEEGRLRGIAERSHEPELRFANDADDMRTAGKGIDPRAMLFDLSSDAIGYAAERCVLVQDKLRKLMEHLPEEGESWQQMTQDYSALTSEMANAVVAVSRYVGGVYVERAHVGQSADSVPLQPVDRGTQLRALAVLQAHAFGPEVWSLPPALGAHLQVQRRGFDFSKAGEDPKLHDRVARIQKSLLDHLLNRTVLNRMVDSAMYGDALPVGEMLSVLTVAVMQGDEGGAPSTVRQTLQAEYVDRLLRLMADGAALPPVQAAAHAQVMQVQEVLEQGGVFAGAAAHSQFLRYKIRRGLDLPSN